MDYIRFHVLALSAPTPTSALPFFSAVAPQPTLTSGGDELGRLRERIMINQLMNQHAFNNTFSWLNQLPKPIPTTRPLDLSHTNDADEDMVINVEKDIDSPKPDDDDEKLNISISDSEDPKSEGTKRTDSPCENACTSSTVGSSPSHTGSLPSPVNHFKKSRTSPSAFHHLNVDSRAFVTVSSPSHVSPSETNSSISPDGQNRPACYECALYKTKLTMADNKCRYLESRANTLQGETVRAQTQTAAAETAIRVLENETRNLRDHTENIQRKLLDCQEQALRFVQSDKTGNQQAVVLFLNQLIQSTIIR
ncbi:unnamed protein product [Auanema sp. JU1783]|nr:unnamed protein product [Auanema sp. JU1783]